MSTSKYKDSLNRKMTNKWQKRTTTSSKNLIAMLLSSLFIIQFIMITGTHASVPVLTETVEVVGFGGSRPWRRLIDAAVAAYEILTPGVVITMNSYPDTYVPPDTASTTSAIGRSMLASNSVDFSTADAAAPAADIAKTPDLYCMPTAAQALVITYNIPGVTSLVLSMSVAARIFIGNITRWNDPAIAALNSGVALPAMNITTIIRGDVLAMNSVLATAMQASLPQWTSIAGIPGAFLNLPTNPNIMALYNTLAYANAMSVTPYSFGYMWYMEAVAWGVSFANIQTPAGAILVPSADSVLYAVMEKGGVPLVQGVTTIVNLDNPTGPSAWPMSGYSFLVIRKEALRETCSTKTAMLKFWEWFYTSTTAAELATNLGAVIPPASILASHGILTTINNAVYCSGSLAYPAERTLVSIGAGTSLAAPILSLYPQIYNNLPTTTGTISYTLDDSDDALKRLAFSEIDFGIVAASNMQTDTLMLAIDSGEVMHLPLFASRYVVMYNVPGLTSAEEGLILDFPSLSLIMMGVITNWQDNRIQALNPQLSAAGRLPNLNITRIAARTGSRETDRLFLMTLEFYTMGTSAHFNLSRSTNGVALPLLSHPWISGQRGIVSTETDTRIQAGVLSTPGGIGIAAVTNDLQSTTTIARLQKNNGEVVSQSPTASYRCLADTYNATSMRFKSALSTAPGCWPLTNFVYSLVRTDNTGDECINAPRALKFLQFLHDQTSVTAEYASNLGTFVSDNDDLAISNELTDISQSEYSASLARTSQVAESLGALWAPPQIRAIVQSRLKTITCDGETILVTLPIDHRIGTAVESSAMAISILGLCLVVLIVCFIYFFHLRSAIKASSPLFLILTILGLALLFLAGPWLTRDDPTTPSCDAGWWLFNIGFYMTFGPLFAKAWRIYKIFMRKEMTVIRLTDFNLMTRLGFGLLFEITMLGIMEAVDPMGAHSTVQSSYPRDQTIYYCSPSSYTMASIITGYKAVMLLFGAMMSFSTRTVSENFNESKPIALAIYNVIFTCCIIVPIALLQQADGRTLYLTTIFGMYWITYSTFFILFLPKIITIYKDASGFIAQRISDSKASASELSRSAQVGRTIKELAQVPIRLMDRVTLRTYVALLEKELTQARAALATLDANEGILAGGVAGASGPAGPSLVGARKSSQDVLAGSSGFTSSNQISTTTVNPTINTNNSRQFGSPSFNGNSGRPYATTNNSPKGSRDLGMARSGTMTKYIAPNSNATSGLTVNVRGASSVAPAPSPSSAAAASASNTFRGPTPIAGSSSHAMMSSNNEEQKRQQTQPQQANSQISVPGSPSATSHNNNDSFGDNSPGGLSMPGVPNNVDSPVLSSLGIMGSKSSAATAAANDRFRMPSTASPPLSKRSGLSSTSLMPSVSSAASISPPPPGGTSTPLMVHIGTPSGSMYDASTSSPAVGMNGGDENQLLLSRPSATTAL